MQRSRERLLSIALIGVLLLVLSSDMVFAECADRYEIDRYLFYGTAYDKEEENIDLDLTLIIDRSGSMQEENRMDKAKQAAARLISLLNEQDRVSVISFDQRSRVDLPFTTDRNLILNAVNSIQPGTTTQYRYPLRDAIKLTEDYPSLNNKVVVFLSDGQPDDEGKPDSIFNVTQELVEKGVCLFTVGYGRGVQRGGDAAKTLEGMSRISYNASGCGRFFTAQDSSIALTEVFNQIYSEVSSDFFAMPIDIVLPRNADTMVIQTEMQSKFNGLPIPGYVDDSRCIKGVNIYVDLERDGEHIRTYNMKYDALSGRYMLNAGKPEPGEYNVRVRAEIGCLRGECAYYKTVSSSLVVRKVRETCKLPVEQQYLYITREPQNVLYVDITDYSFVPAAVDVKLGQTIVWRNVGRHDHQIVSGFNSPTGHFRSRVLRPGDTFSYKFDDPAVRDYYDALSLNPEGAKGALNNSERKQVFSNQQSVDLTLVMDKSGSMVGDSMDEMKAGVNALIDMMQSGDRAAVVEFSDKAKVGQRFTSDKRALLDAIDKIRPTGATFYIPGLDIAHTLFLTRPPRENTKNLLILLTDGKALDEGSPGSILQKTKRLVRDGICMYTIGYGEEIRGDSEARQLLVEMTDLSREDINCGEYYYTIQNSTRLSKIFGEIYSEITKGSELRIDVEDPRTVYKRNDEILFKAHVRSKYNDIELPSISAKECVDPANVSLRVFDSERTMSEIPLFYDYDAESYIGRYKFLEDGEYFVQFNSIFELDDTTASLRGEQSLGMVKVYATNSNMLIYFMENSWLIFVVIFGFVSLAMFVLMARYQGTGKYILMVAYVILCYFILAAALYYYAPNIDLEWIVQNSFILTWISKNIGSFIISAAFFLTTILFILLNSESVKRGPQKYIIILVYIILLYILGTLWFFEWVG